jgi:hypothetical protein
VLRTISHHRSLNSNWQSRSNDGGFQQQAGACLGLSVFQTAIACSGSDRSGHAAVLILQQQTWHFLASKYRQQSYCTDAAPFAATWDAAVQW